MPKRKNPLTPEEQRKRFESEVRKRISAGELDPEEAGAALDRLVKRSGPKTTSPPS